MGIQYGNLTLYGISQQELVDYLTYIGEEAYVSPTFNKCTILYFENYLDRKKNRRFQNLDANWENIFKPCYANSLAPLVFFAFHLSKTFSCPALSVFVYDGYCFWYCLYNKGLMLDEYTTCGGDDWQIGQGMLAHESDNQIKGGDAEKLCKSFEKEQLMSEVKAILTKPDGYNYKLLDNFDGSRYDALIQVESYDSPTTRHEALARALGICPGLVVGLNYRAIESGELADFWEDFQDYSNSEKMSFEEIDLMIQKTFFRDN